LPAYNNALSERFDHGISTIIGSVATGLSGNYPGWTFTSKQSTALLGAPSFFKVQINSLQECFLLIVVAEFTLILQ